MKNKFKILLVINKPSRETHVMESIKREIILVEPDALVEIRRMSSPWFNKFVFEFKPHVILTFPFTAVGLARYFHLFKFFLGTKIISYRTEGVIDFNDQKGAQIRGGFEQYSQNLVDYEILWGEKTAKVIGKALLMAKKISSIERIKVAGYPRLEHYFNISSKKPLAITQKIHEKLSNYPKEKIILFVSGFARANYSKEALIRARDLDAKNNIDELLQVVNIVKDFRSEWIENILKTARENPEALIVCKKHPNEKKLDFKAYEGTSNILYVHENLEINGIMPYAGIIFHHGSTTLVDSYILKIPSVLVYSTDSYKWFPDFGWPSTAKIDVRSIPQTVKRFLSGDITFKDNDRVKIILKEIFNIELDKPYKPSREIAEIILDPEPPHKIKITDPFLWKAMGWFLLRTINVATFHKAEKLLNYFK